MLRLCAFADEISHDLDETIRACRECGIGYVELGSIGGTSVLDFIQPVRAEVKARLDSAGIGVVCIASPVGWAPIAEPWRKHFDRFKTAIDAAAYFGASLVRIYSYYPTRAGDDMRRHREEIIRRTRTMVEHVTGGDITLVHENAAGTFGQTAIHCADIVRSINSRALRCAFDFADFVLSGQDTADAWPVLRQMTIHMHVNDARFNDGVTCFAGEGDGRVSDVIADAYANGYRGYLSIRPPLAASTVRRASDVCGPRLFRDAVDAVRFACAVANVPLAT